MRSFIISLLNMSITACIIIMAVLCIRLLLRKAPKVFSYALWGIVLLRLLCPISFSSQFSMFNLLDVETGETGAMQYISQSEDINVPAANWEPTTIVANGYATGGGEANKAEAEVYQPLSVIQPDLQAPQTSVNGYENENIHSEVLPEEAPHAKDHTFTVYRAAFIVWIVGALVLVTANAVSLICLRRKLAASMPLQGNVYLCDEIDTPFCLGILRAKIFLPSALEEQERSYILLHEKYHIRRCDHVIKLLAFLALCIHWFNPLVWLAFALAGKDMEMSCDEAVMRQMDSDIRAEYSASLLHLATGRRFAPSPLAFGEGNPKDRIRNIMNYKKPAFWMIAAAIVVCAGVAVVLGTNPKKKNAEEIDQPEVTESMEASAESDEEPDNKEMTSQEKFRENYRRQMLRENREKAYSELIRLAETAIYDRESLGDNYEAYLDEEGNALFSSEVTRLYDGSSDNAYQNIGYLIQDINGDGVPELLFGENDVHPGGGWDGIIYDMYTYADQKPVHVFQGWNRCRYYLTSDGCIAMQGESSAFEGVEEYFRFDGKELISIEKIDTTYDYEAFRSAMQYSSSDGSKVITEAEAQKIRSKYQIVCPEFQNIGPIWLPCGDISGDSREDYVIRTGMNNIYNHLALYICGEGIIYEHEDPITVEMREIRKVDLDHDGEDELALIMLPWVNSTGLMEYAVLKKDGTSWRELEVYTAKNDPMDNSFPVHVVHDKVDFDIGIYCEGLHKSINIDVEEAYRYWQREAKKDSSSAQFYVDYYENELLKAPTGSEVGGVSSWGVWDIEVSTFGGQPCLVAEHGINGADLRDFWGFLYIFFDYDAKGKIRIRDIQFTQHDYSNQKLISEAEQEALNAYADFFTTPDGLVGIDGYAPEQLVFSLEYIDGDEIPEMVIGCADAPHASSTYILSFHDGQVIVSREPIGTYGEFGFIEETGILAVEDYAMDVEVLYYFRLEDDGELTLLCGRERTYKDSMEPFAYSLSLADTKCTVSGKSVTEEVFEAYVTNLEKNKSVKRWSSYENYYRLSQDTIQSLRDDALHIGMAGTVRKKTRELLYGSIGEIFGTGSLAYSRPQPPGQDYKLYFVTEENESRVFIFPDAREGNLAIGDFYDMYFVDTADLNGDRRADILAIARYWAGEELLFDTRVYVQAEDGYQLDGSLTAELNMKYARAEEYPVGDIIELPHD